jgi:hypothetical protein
MKHESYLYYRIKEKMIDFSINYSSNNHLLTSPNLVPSLFPRNMNEYHFLNDNEENDEIEHPYITEHPEIIDRMWEIIEQQYILKNTLILQRFYRKYVKNRSASVENHGADRIRANEENIEEILQRMNL